MTNWKYPIDQTVMNVFPLLKPRRTSMEFLKTHFRVFACIVSVMMMNNACLSVVDAQTAPANSVRAIEDPGEGRYEIPYQIPRVEDITQGLDRIRNYIVQNTRYEILDQKTGKILTDFSVVNQNAVLNSGTERAFWIWSYPMGVICSGMLRAGEVTGNPAFTDYAVKNVQFIVDCLPYFRRKASKFGDRENSLGPIIHIRSLDDCGSMGDALIKTYRVKSDKRIRAIIDTIAEYISHKQFRLDDGTLARQRPQARSLWTDDMYMSIPFLGQMYKLTGDTVYADDAVKQVLQFSKRLFIQEKKIYDHGWHVNLDYDPRFFWGRANGWAITAMVELLSVLPENYPGRDDVLKILRTHVQGLVELQGGSGLWHNMLDKTDTYDETSCSAMFVYGIARGINRGWIDQSFGPAAQAGWNAVASRVLADGRVEGTCAGTTLASDNVYYYHRPTPVNELHGYGPVLLAGSEMILLMKNVNIEIRKANRTYHYRLRNEK
jgi:unsaturated rhamnogalacturonyl hydrolase